MLLPVCLMALLMSGCRGNVAAGLRSHLLSVADLPAGWSAAPKTASTPEVTNTPCLARLSPKPKGWTYQTASFVDGESIPNFGEVLASGARSAQTWARFDRALAHCRTATVQFGRTKGLSR